MNFTIFCVQSDDRIKGLNHWPNKDEHCVATSYVPLYLREYIVCKFFFSFFSGNIVCNLKRGKFSILTRGNLPTFGAFFFSIILLYLLLYSHFSVTVYNVTVQL